MFHSLACLRICWLAAQTNVANKEMSVVCMLSTNVSVCSPLAPYGGGRIGKNKVTQCICTWRTDLIAATSSFRPPINGDCMACYA